MLSLCYNDPWIESLLFGLTYVSNCMCWFVVFRFLWEFWLLQVHKRSNEICLQFYEKELLTDTSYLHIYGFECCFLGLFTRSKVHRSIFCVPIWLIEVYYYRLQEHELNSKQLAVVAVRTKSILYTLSHDYSALNKPSMQHGFSLEMDLWLLESKSCYGLLIILFRIFFARFDNFWMFWL